MWVSLWRRPVLGSVGVTVFTTPADGPYTRASPPHRPHSRPTRPRSQAWPKVSETCPHACTACLCAWIWYPVHVLRSYREPTIYPLFFNRFIVGLFLIYKSCLGRWFPPGTPVSFTRKLISSSSFHRLDNMTQSMSGSGGAGDPAPLFGPQCRLFNIGPKVGPPPAPPPPSKILDQPLQPINIYKSSVHCYTAVISEAKQWRPLVAGTDRGFLEGGRGRTCGDFPNRQAKEKPHMGLKWHLRVQKGQGGRASPPPPYPPWRRRGDRGWLDCPLLIWLPIPTLKLKGMIVNR